MPGSRQKRAIVLQQRDEQNSHAWDWPPGVSVGRRTPAARRPVRLVKAPESTLSTGTHPQYTHLYGLSAEAAILYRSTQLRPHHVWAQLLLFCGDQGAPRSRLMCEGQIARPPVELNKNS